MTELLKRKGERKPYDNYPTPQNIADFTVKKSVSIIGGHRIFDNPGHKICFLEPGCGSNAPFLSAAVKHFKDWRIALGVEIQPDIANWNPELRITTCDFLEIPVGDGGVFDVIATNPPFSHALEFWHKSMDLLKPGGILGLVTKLSFLATKKRSEVWEKYPPYLVYIIYPRPSFSKDGKTDIAQEYCISFWQKDGTPRTELKWFKNE